MSGHAPHGDRDTAVPGPPLIPDHMGQPSYAECAKAAWLVGFCDEFHQPLPPTISPGFASQLRKWMRREVELGNLTKLRQAVDA